MSAFNWNRVRKEFPSLKEYVYLNAAGGSPISRIAAHAAQQSYIDFLVSTSQKWPAAGYGAGVLYMHKRWLKQVSFPVVGWQSVKDAHTMNNRDIVFKEDASVVEGELAQMHNIFALGSAIKMINTIGVDRIQKRIFDLQDYLIERVGDLGLEILSPLEQKYRSGITVIKVRNPEQIAQRLYRKKIVVLVKKGGLRVSLHIYNNEKDIDRFIHAVKHLM